ncbi:MAG: polysaccharide deacetylase family protein, partial [Theionarchaea archaeon]|nr:polysaccharide deacetylase family protein [Theionarchaea archaeon]
MRELYVAFTMDCERIASESPPGGPETWELSERAISGYCDFLLESDLYPTLFIVPECAKKHRPLFGTLSRKGVELGLHLHPQSFDKHQYCKYLGEYERDDQLRIIGESRREFTRALGAEPKSFRSGNFSANDDTFPVLDSLGFLQGSVSDPGRNAPGFAATWMGACPDPHWVSGV